MLEMASFYAENDLVINPKTPLKPRALITEEDHMHMYVYSLRLQDRMSHVPCPWQCTLCSPQI